MTITKNSAPSYVLLRSDGVFIRVTSDLTKETLRLFVDRLFGHETRFDGLDYSAFIGLLYGDTLEQLELAEYKDVRIANSLVPFPQSRQMLYKTVKIELDGSSAEYMFESIFIDAADGSVVMNSTKENVGAIQADLNFDEFVASMWIKGLRFGIHADAVKDVLRKNLLGRMEVASHLPATEPRDSKIEEACTTMHLDKSVKTYPDGRIDLRRAQNRFPQASAGTVLLKKIPQVPGKPGYRVSGEIIYPRPPVDVDLELRAGEGTRVDTIGEIPVVIAAIDGYINIETHTKRITITEKLENRSGISAKATGDVKLEVDQFREHGEVQEGRVIEGKALTFLSSVFGTTISRGGDTIINKNLSGGKAISFGGNITVKGKSISAEIDAKEGVFLTDYAEDCKIIARHVRVKHAVNCEIVADEVDVDFSEGSLIAGRVMNIKRSTNLKSQESVFTIVLPNFVELEEKISEQAAQIEQSKLAIQKKVSELSAAKNDEVFDRYLALKEQVDSGKIVITIDRKAGWDKLVSRYAGSIRQIEEMKEKQQKLQTRLDLLESVKNDDSKIEKCVVLRVEGDTVVKRFHSNQGLIYFHDMKKPQLKSVLQQLGPEHDRMFFRDNGSFSWVFSEAGADKGLAA
jgi:uncharacterized protein (DUF342 family)